MGASDRSHFHCRAFCACATWLANRGPRPRPYIRAVNTRLVLSLALSSVAVATARAGWNPVRDTIKATSANIPLVGACADDADGSFVTWQEESSPGAGILRAQHVLATGDPDPAWPAVGAVACTVVVARASLGCVPDHQGGLYTWWREGNASYVTRLNAAGNFGNFCGMDHQSGNAALTSSVHCGKCLVVVRLARKICAICG